MPFAIRHLSVIAYSEGFTLWHYNASTETVCDTVSHGFFDDAVLMMVSGDMIHVSAVDGGATLFVSSTSNNKVAVAAMSASVPLMPALAT